MEEELALRQLRAQLGIYDSTPGARVWWTDMATPSEYHLYLHDEDETHFSTALVDGALPDTFVKEVHDHFLSSCNCTLLPTTGCGFHKAEQWVFSHMVCAKFTRALTSGVRLQMSVQPLGRKTFLVTEFPRIANGAPSLYARYMVFGFDPRRDITHARSLAFQHLTESQDVASV